MRTFIIAVALVGTCLAVPQVYEKSVDYEIPSGKVSYSSHVPVDGVYGAVQPAFRYGQTAAKSVFGGYVQPAVKPVYGGYVQPAVKSVYGGYVQPAVKSFYDGYVQPAVKPVYGGYVQPAVKSFVAQPVHQVQTYGQVHPVHDKVYDESVYGKAVYGAYVQPTFKYDYPAKVVKPAVPFVQPVAPAFNKYVAEARISQPVAPVVQQVSPVVYPAPKFSYPAVQHGYVQPVENVKPVVRYGQVAAPFVHQPVTKFAHVASPVARFGHVAAPAITPYVHPVAKYAQVAAPAPVYHHDVVAKTAEAPAAIVAQSHDSSVDGSFVANFQTENGIQSTVSGSVKPVVGSDEPAQVMSGSYSYTSPDGTPVVTHWYADENGFHADGDHIPAVPEEIQRSVDYLSSIPQTYAPELKYKHY